jgi:putative membrane protein
MTSLNRKSLFKQLVTVAGIAGVSSLIAVPGLAELNRQTHGFNQSGDRVFDLADNATDDRTAPGSPATEPNNNNNPGRSPNTPTTPSNNTPGRSPNTPTTPSNNTPGRSPNSPTTPSNNTPGRSPNSPTTPSNNTPGRSPNSPTTPSNNNPGRSPNSPGGGQTSPNSLSSKDRTFVMQAGQLSMMEVELGRLAVKRGSSPGVKQYGQEMVEDHTRANQELMQLAMQKKVELPTEMSTQNTALIDRLSGLSGKSFDTAYKQAMIDSHNQAIALFEAQSQQGQDPELKAWATEKLPNLQAHLKMVNQMLADTSQP